jgi:hypothetical protein
MCEPRQADAVTSGAAGVSLELDGLAAVLRRLTSAGPNHRATHRVFALGSAGLLLSAAALALPASAVAAPITVCTSTCTVAFAVTGAPETWTVPVGVVSATFSVAGGSGGDSLPFFGPPGGTGGAGGRVTATLPVTPGHVLSVVVGAAGAGGVAATPNVPAPGGYGGGGTAGSDQVGAVTAPGGAGGGGSFIFDTTTWPAVALVVAGGGGGAATNPAGSGVLAGGAGGSGGNAGATPQGFGVSGGAATTTSPGAGGTGLGVDGSAGTGAATGPTVLGAGGAGSVNPGGGGLSTPGGGGGGYYGGGGGGSDGAGGINGPGGGGSGFLAAGATAVTTSTNTGDGLVTITYIKSMPTVTLAAPTTGTAGTAVTFTATVTSAFAGGQPIPGSVSFAAGFTNLGAIALVNGVATITTTLPVGTYLIEASYVESAGLLGAGSLGTTLVVSAAPVAPAAATAELANTGTYAGQLAGLGLGLLVAGLLVMGAARRVRRRG